MSYTPALEQKALPVATVLSSLLMISGGFEERCAPSDSLHLSTLFMTGIND